MRTRDWQLFQFETTNFANVESSGLDGMHMITHLVSGATEIFKNREHEEEFRWMYKVARDTQDIQRRWDVRKQKRLLNSTIPVARVETTRKRI